MYSDSPGIHDDGFPTRSSLEQKQVEDTVCDSLEKHELSAKPLSLDRESHCKYLLKGLEQLSSNYECLDASRTWICYWILHALDLLGVEICQEAKRNVVTFLRTCQSPSGGFGGGPDQYPHLATTYAAVNAICILGFEEAFQVINREALKEFLQSMISLDGSMTMQKGGETDIRGVYCAASVASICNIDMSLFNNTAEWIAQCQTYEGGFAGAPGLEAHGGLSFCGIAALMLLERETLCDVDALLHWASKRQMSYEGGFQGRTNKLVDACYSFWQGGIFPLINFVLYRHHQNDSLHPKQRFTLFNQEALQSYLLTCCQHHSGGMFDKPGKGRDFYHTCYALSGLSVAQHGESCSEPKLCVVGDPSNELRPVHPVYNIVSETLASAVKWFKSQPQI